MAYFWYQMVGGDDAWREALATHRAKIISEQSPAFVTVLDAFDSPDESWGRDEYAKMRYAGPLYFDFDAEDVEDGIKNFKLFLANLNDFGVSPNTLRLYASGGRGFHIEVPQPIFMAKVPKTGTAALPYIYREMAMELVVDTLDMRVYTGRKGRMWRTPNVKRSNGKYKVPLTTAEALEITVESYEELTSTPRPEPYRADPELNPTLAAMFAKAQSKVDEAQKRRAKGGNADEALLVKFKGQFPPTVEKILRGEGLAPNVGFHKVAMQLAILTNALGKSADQLVESATELCKNYSGDSSRYGSPRKRKEELRRMWEYTHDNPCYGYSRGGIRSLLDVDTPSGDLDGMQSFAGVGYVPDSEEDEGEDLPEDMVADINSAQMALLEGLIITKTGVHKRTAEGARTVCNIGFAKPTQLVDAEDCKVLGIEVNVLCDGVPAGRHTVPGKVFTSRSNLSGWCSDFGGIFSGSDTQAGAVQLMLSRSAKKGGRVVYALHKEGLDLIQDPTIKDRVQKDSVWVHPEGVLTYSTTQYVFQPQVASSPIYNADVHNAPPLTASADAGAWLDALLSVNSPTIVAQMLGWIVSCFHRQHYHHAYSQFPLLHPNGPAGCGKTLTTKLMAGMFYCTSDVVMKSCAPTTTPFTLKAAMTGSASVPIILDEYKPSEMGQLRTDLLTQSFRLAYNQGAGASGGMSRGNATGSFRDITEYTYSTPVAFLAEAQEMQTAVAQRYIAVGFNPMDTTKWTAQFDRAVAGKNFMAPLGNLLLRRSFNETVETRREALDPIIAELRAAFDAGVHDRQVFNLAVVMAGLNFLDTTLRQVFKDRFAARFDVLRQAIMDHRSEINMPAMSEAAKMINDLSLISRSESTESPLALREGVEYIVKEGYIEILMREAFVKYFAWCKQKGFTPYYASAETFMSAMGKFGPTTDKLCLQSPLKKSGQTRVFRFNLERLSQEGIEPFLTKAG